MKSLLSRGSTKLFLALAAVTPASLASRILFALRSRPHLTDRWGYHIRPIHYYEPFPDLRRISAGALERNRFSPAIDYRLDAQRELVSRLGAEYGDEIEEIGRLPGLGGFDFQNPYFAGLDAAVYFALIRDQKPKRVVEIGSGFSTQIASLALARNAQDGSEGQLVCIEPYPEPRLIQSGASFELIEKLIQDVPLPFFAELGKGDILFIDSSHVATADGDVNYELLDILPRLAPGVWVHVHDIFLPRDYPAEWVINRRLAFNEQYVLEAFLAFNQAFEVELANSWLWREYHVDAHLLFDGMPPASPPGSFWIRRKK